jgi:phage terminase large subunit-like protein
LIRYVLNRSDFDHPWLYERCNEYQEAPFGYLDLWAREHRKSTIITYAHSLFEIIRSHGDEPYDPDEVTIGIFSHTRPIAKSFLRQIKREIETNEYLVNLFADVFWSNPDKDAPTWSEDAGLVVKRKNNPKEATVEAWGLVDGQPTGKHFSRLVYDDVVTLKSVATTEMIQKTTNAWSLSLNLGTEDGKVKTIGTRYHYADTYEEMIKRGSVIVRKHTGVDNDELDGNPLLLAPEVWRRKVRDMGSFVASCQLLQRPKPDSASTFKQEDLRFYDGQLNHKGMNVYILVDPANEKNKRSDWTAVIVVGLGSDENYYILALYRDKLGLTERANLLIDLHRKYRPLRVYYEQYGMQADVSHIRYVQAQITYRFEITPFGGQMGKHDRIRRLLPITETNRLWLPRTQHRTIYDGQTIDLVDRFIEEEYKAFPLITGHDDVLDIMSRIQDPDINLIFPKVPIRKEKRDPYSDPPTQAGSFASRR